VKVSSGWLRLGVVLSACWVIAVVSTAAYQRLSGPPYGGFFVDVIFVDTATGKEHVMREVYGPVLPLTTPMAKSVEDPKIVGDLIPTGNTLRPWRVVGVAVVPLIILWPLVFLLIFTFGWVKEGFR
jgi:hypothetical protein